jgi:hypothetical protein
MKPTSFFTGINKFKSAISTGALLIILSFMLIGGCNNSNSNQVDARTIGDIDGAIVPALKKAFTLRQWQEGDPDGDLYLNASRIATLTDAEQQAVNDAYQMGYIVAIINPDIDHILDMHVVLGLNPLFGDNGTLDLLGFSREFNVSGIRYFILRPYQDGPIPEDINLDRVAALTDWAQVSSASVSTAQVDLRETGEPSELTKLADSTSWTEHGTWPAERDPNPQLAEYTPDLQVRFTGFARAWSVHSIANDNDFYYLRTNYILSPLSTLGPLGSICNVPICSAEDPPDFECPGTGPEAEMKGVIQYTLNNTQPTFNSSELNVIEFNPTTTTGEVTTSSSIDHTFSDNVSYSQEEGAEVGVSSSSTYSHSTSYTSPSVTTTAMIAVGPNMNNAEWVWFVGDSNVSKATFEPNFQWIWEAAPSTRGAGSITWEQGFDFFSFPYTCASPRTSTFIPVLKIAIPIPPLPKDCSTNQDCGVGQVCGTDLSPAICVAQQCDDMMLCPKGFECLNEECQPSNSN